MSKNWLKRKKSCQKVVKKLSKSCQKVVKKLIKGSAMYHWSFYESREAIERKNQQRGIVVPRPSASASLTSEGKKWN
jgi:hypothetical protein